MSYTLLRNEPSVPERRSFEGQDVRIEPLSADLHGEDLWKRLCGEENAELWRYLADGPFYERKPFREMLDAKEASADPLFYAIVNRHSGVAVGQFALMRIEPKHRVVEIGNILFGRDLQQTRAATEALYLLSRYVFEELGYRRYEWKCNAENVPSRRAALRLGFVFEGIFRQHMIVKGHNRDTAWFSMLDSEWPARKEAFERWLDPGNFDEDGRQRRPLEREVSR